MKLSNDPESQVSLPLVLLNCYGCTGFQFFIFPWIFKSVPPNDSLLSGNWPLPFDPGGRDHGEKKRGVLESAVRCGVRLSQGA